MHRFYWLIIILLFAGCASTPEQQLQQAKEGVTATALSSDGRYGVIASSNHDIGVWDLKQKKLLYTWRHSPGQTPNIIAISISPDNNFVLTAERKNIVLWDLRNGKSLHFWATKSDILDVALSRNGQFALLGLQNGKADYIDLTTGHRIKQFQHLETVNAVALSADGRFALTGSDDKSAILWGLNPTKLLHHWRHKKRVRYVTFSPKSSFALTSASQASVKIWDTTTGGLKNRLKHPKVTITSAKFSANERTLAIGVLPQRLELWDVNSNKKLQQWTVPRSDGWKPTSTFIYAIAYTPDQSLITEDSRGYASWWKLYP